MLGQCTHSWGFQCCQLASPVATLAAVSARQHIAVKAAFTAYSSRLSDHALPKFNVSDMT